MATRFKEIASMTIKNRVRFALALMLSLVMALTGMSLATPTYAQDSSTLVVGFAQEPDSMNGFYSAMAFAQWANDLVQASLYDFSDKLEPVLVLAAEVPTRENGGISEDFTEYTVKLKPGLKWSDGKPLTAEDLVFTYQMIKDPANNMVQGGSIRDALESVELVDETTFRLKFNAPKPFPEDLIGSPGLSTILPAHVFRPIYEANGTIENAEENQNPKVFSGPYILREWKRGESMLFEANPNYVFGEPKIKRVLIRFFPDTDSQYAALAAGQLDFVPNVSEGDLPRVAASNPDLKLVTVFGGYIESLWLNLQEEGKGPRAGHPALKDVRVRRALRLAIDRETITRELLAGATKPTDSIYAGSPFENKELGVTPYDPEAAAALLDEAGWVVGADGVREKDGVKLELRYSTTTAGWRNNIQAVIQQQLAKVGVSVILEKYPASEYFGTYANNGVVASGQFDIGQFANNTALTNPANVTVDESLSCAQIVSDENPSGNNWTGFCNAEMDSLSQVTKTSLDPEERLRAAYRIQEIMRDEVPLINLFPRGDNYAYNTKRFVGEIRIGSGVGNQWFDIMNWQLR
ncbi:MAG: peptide ABC transporter substrate-binding protein [Chloroflexota bacterium]|nr:MAG: peptide ABC transporter substrate-binding protein [Chloroflexota bacterium]